MAQNLFPVFDVPEIKASTVAAKQKYKSSVYFDYEKGDFRRDGANKMTEADGREAYMQWCMKIVMTERFKCLSYNVDIGIEMESALTQADAAAVESDLERTITEALRVNPKTEYVRGFEFAWSADSLYCSFIVKGHMWEEQRMGISLKRIGGE